MDTETISVTLPAETVRAIRRKVDSGAYASPDAVIEEAALRLLEEDGPEGATVTPYMREAIMQSLVEPGPDTPMEDVFENLNRRLREGR